MNHFMLGRKFPTAQTPSTPWRESPLHSSGAASRLRPASVAFGSDCRPATPTGSLHRDRRRLPAALFGGFAPAKLPNRDRGSHRGLRLAPDQALRESAPFHGADSQSTAAGPVP